MADSFLLSIHRTDGHLVVGVCDENLLGKKFEEDDKILDVTPSFFGGTRASLQEVIRAIHAAKTANIVGNAIISQLIGENVVKESGVHEIQHVKYAHIYKI